ncbi:MAG: beta-glucosidase, partial [Planctomycetales bacterium]|nr:beta-glucosidase [Planctomycetales bacterium]
MTVCALGLLALLQVAPPPSMSSRVEELLSRMTLEEKLGQLTLQWGGEIRDTNPGIREQKQEETFGVVRSGALGAIIGAHGAEYTNRVQHIAIEESRLGIPVLFGNDVIHGYRTIFPIPLGEAATWNPELIQAAAHVAATEARASGTNWTYAPMVDLCRDPRWGRIAETSGEDPWLSSQMAAARVRGFQGDDLTRPDAVMACLKHFVAYGGAEGGRDYNTVDISRRTLHEIHLPSFKAGVEAGARTLMSAFNEIGGVPASGCRYTLRDVLRDDWGFDGFVVSDWTSVTEMIAHGFAKDAADAAEIAIRAGVDMDMASFSFRDHLDEAVGEGRVDITLIDDAVRRVLLTKFELGLFQNPYIDTNIEK